MMPREQVEKLSIARLARSRGDRFRKVFTSNDYLVQIAAVEAGVGAMVLGRKFHRLSRIDRLVELKVDLGPAALFTFHLVVAKRMVDDPRDRGGGGRPTGRADSLAGGFPRPGKFRKRVK
jgi:DNA-binding transcriptional LysR family regulator